MKSTPLLLSAVVLTKNEAGNLAACLKSLQFCDEVVVIDDNSTDSTQKIAKKFNTRFFKHGLNNNFALQRNFALTKTKGSWILFIDADERVTKKLAYEIVKTIKNEKKYRGFFVRRVDILWGRKIVHGEIGEYGAFGNGYILRLGKKGYGKWTRNIHEQWEINGEVRQLTEELVHLPHQTLYEFLDDIGQRGKIHAQEISKEGKKSSLFKVLFWPSGKLLYNFIFKLGFLDGVEGFVLAMIMSFHSFISWSYLWLNQK